MTTSRHRGLRHPFSVVATCFVALGVAGGIHFFVFPVYLDPIREDLGVSLTQVTFGLLLWGLIGAAASPLAGRALYRLGVRRVMVAGTALQIVGTLLLATSHSLAQLYLALCLSAVAAVGNTYLAVAEAITLRFDEHRGRALGVGLFGLSVGGLTMPLLADQLLVHGWRTGYLVFAGLLFALLPVLWLGLDPGRVDEPVEERPAHPGEDAAATLQAGSLSPEQAIRTRTFWGLGIGDGLAGLIFAFLNVHLVSLAIEGGVERTTATTFFSVFLFLTGPGTLVAGALADRWPIRRLMVICYAGPLLVLPALLWLPSPLALGLFVGVAGLCAGGRNAAFPLSIADSFGPRSVATVYGWLNVLFMVGNAVGPLLAGYLHDTSGSYVRPLYASMARGVVSVVAISLLRDERRDYRQRGESGPGASPDPSML